MTNDLLHDYRRAEANHAPRSLAVQAGLGGVVAIAGCQLLFPRMPAQVIDFLQQAFDLPDIAAVILFNDYLAVYFVAFFVGMFGLLGVVVGPREDHRLELLLAKPVPAADFLAARTWPVLWLTALVGVVLSLACVAATLPYRGETTVTAAGALGAGLAVTGLVLLQMTVLSVLFIRIRDSMNATMLALMFALVPMIPAAVYLYRPDVFAGKPTLTSAIVLANLVWHDAQLVWLGPLILMLALACTALGVRTGGRLLANAG